MRKACKFFAIVTVFLASMLVLAISAGAGLGGFSVTPEIPENQVGDATAFFDLEVVPGTHQELILHVNNHRNEPISVEMSIYTAGTNMNGIIDYAADALTDASIPFLLNEIASLPPGAEDLTIPANTAAAVPISLNIPAGHFDGVTLGAVRVLLGITEEERAEAGMIVNRFANIVPIRMRVAGTPEIEPDFYLGEIGGEVVSMRGSFVAHIHNLAPRMSMGAITSTWIYPAGSDEPIFTQLDLSTDFAPNAIFPATMMDMEGFGIHAGDYLARVRIEYDGRVWNFEREFTVDAEAAQQVSQGAINQQSPMPMAEGGRSLPLPIIIAIAVGALLLLAVIILILKNRKRNQQAEWIQSPAFQPPGAGAIQPPPPPEVKSDKQADLEQLLEGKSEDEIKQMLEQMKSSKTSDN